MNTLLDCRTLACPEPVLRTRALLSEGDSNDFTILVDNAAACENVCRFLQNKGIQTSMRHDEQAKEWRIETQRSTAQAPCPVQQEQAVPQAQAAAKTLVFISTETLGRGDDALGSKLMGNFLATLPELGARLWRIVLVNGGVKLTATQGKCLESLQALAAAGVSILVCGACLEHYGLSAAKQVGETTNMLDIVTSLDMADKIIRP
jgi:selenium metabolism protein YedF